MPFVGVKVDGVGEVRGDKLLTLTLEPFVAISQLGKFLGAGGNAFVERDLDLLGQRTSNKSRRLGPDGSSMRSNHHALDKLTNHVMPRVPVPAVTPLSPRAQSSRGHQSS